MLDAIMQIIQAVLGFLGVVNGPATKKVEDILPEESASEKALKELQSGSTKSN